MLERLRSGPWWVLSLVLGLYFAVILGVVLRLAGTPTGRAVVGAVIGGALLGAFLGPWLTRQRRHITVALSGASEEPLPLERRRALIRASMRGPLPEDPTDRQAAARLARQRLAQHQRQRLWAPAVYAVMVLSTLYLAVTRSPWWALVGMFMVWVLLSWVMELRSLRERVRLLDADTP